MRIGWEKGGGGEMCLNKKERERREKERCENFGSSLQEEIERGGRVEILSRSSRFAKQSGGLTRQDKGDGAKKESAGPKVRDALRHLPGRNRGGVSILHSGANTINIGPSTYSSLLPCYSFPRETC